MKFVESIKKHKKKILFTGAIIGVAAGHLEFIPYTVAGALEMLAVATVAAGAANEISDKLEAKEKK